VDGAKSTYERNTGEKSKGEKNEEPTQRKESFLRKRKGLIRTDKQPMTTSSSGKEGKKRVEETEQRIIRSGVYFLPPKKKY